MRRLLTAIQQRKLDRIAVAYGVSAWLIVQAASLALPTFGAPIWILKILIAAALFGFPLTLWIGWYLMPAPQQEQSAAPPVRGAEIARLAGLAVLIVLLLALVVSRMNPGAPASQQSASARGPVPAGVGLPPRTSVAVLPFVNLSGDSSKEYFSDGISEEILNQLANVRELRVPARTSSFAFKGKNEDVRTIARVLNVRSVLEGSVREEGRRVRITAQLINAGDGYQIWSKTFDRDLSNILAVQDEIARAIVASLTQGLFGKRHERTGITRPPIDPEAYRNYLQGVSFAARKTDDDDARAVILFTQVTTRQPRFAPAYAALGRTYVHMAQFHGGGGDYTARANAALDTALHLDLRNLEALSSRLLLSLMKWDWRRSAADAQAMQTINPHSVFTLRARGSYYGALGFPEQQSAALREATRLDPLSFVDLNNLATVYLQRNEYAEGASAASDALALKANRPLTLYTLCAANAEMKRFREVQMLTRQLTAAGQPDASRGCLLQYAAATGDKAQATALANTIASHFPAFVFDEVEIARFYLLAGDKKRALTWLGRGYSKRNQYLFALQYFPSTSSELLGLPGWTMLMRGPEARVWQNAHDTLAAQFSAG